MTALILVASDVMWMCVIGVIQDSHRVDGQMAIQRTCHHKCNEYHIFLDHYSEGLQGLFGHTNGAKIYSREYLQHLEEG